MRSRATFAGDFSGSLTLHDFENVSVDVGGNLSGTLLVPENPAVIGSGTIDSLHVHHDVTATGLYRLLTLSARWSMAI